jgi:hypothetical protein
MIKSKLNAQSIIIFKNPRPNYARKRDTQCLFFHEAHLHEGIQPTLLAIKGFLLRVMQTIFASFAILGKSCTFEQSFGEHVRI